MKKMILILACLTLILPSITFAGDFPADLISLSNNVVGAYYVNANPATEYSLSTAHQQGNRVYASSSNDQLIYFYTFTDDGPIDSADLLDAHNSAFSSDAGDFTDSL